MINKIILLLFILFLPLILFSQYKNNQQKREKIRQPIKCPTGSYELVWQDEFEGNQLDTNYWRTTYGSPKPWDCTLPRGECGTELQIYQANNVQVNKGTLKLITRKESITYQGIYEAAHTCANKNIGDTFSLDFKYTSGIIVTKSDKIAFQYGRYETRCKLPIGAGFWPAFWLWGGGGETGRAGEMDILEIFDTAQPIFTTSIHNGNRKARQDIPLTWDIRDWHIYAVEYDPTEVRYFVDGQLIRTYKRFKNLACQDGQLITKKRRYRRNAAFPWEQWMVLMLNLAINPEPSMTVNATTVFPATMEVDYVRVYKRNEEFSHQKRE